MVAGYFFFFTRICKGAVQKVIKKFFLMFIFEREIVSSMGQRERGRQNLKQALGSELSAQSLTQGLNS